MAVKDPLRRDSEVLRCDSKVLHKTAISCSTRPKIAVHTPKKQPGTTKNLKFL
jgi:hypothetical protein